MPASKIKFRASSTGYLMVEPKSKNELISETTKTHLVDVFVSNKYGRNTDIHTRYTTKGLMVEEDSITLYSRFKKCFYLKNDQHLENDFIKGTPDLFVGESISKAEIIIDVKSSWDIFTFFRATQEKLNKQYYWQLQSYMALTGAKNAILAYCLVNTPDTLINDEKRKLLWKMNAGTEDNELYQEACVELERLMTYDDIPLEERVFEIVIERNDADIERLYQRVAQCREYMNENLFKESLV